MLNSIFDQMDFGPLQEFLDDDDVTDVSYSNGGQIWLKTLSKGIYQVERPNINNAFMEKLAFQCSNVMGKTFNMAHPFLDAESAELRMNFVHDSIATNGIAVLMRKTPAMIRLNKEKLIDEDYITEQVHDFLVQCVHARCNIIVAGETGSGKTELVKYLASKTYEDEKIISIEDTLELHLDRIYPNRDIVSMKTNNIASYSEALVACMRQNPIWILLSEVRSGEAVLAVRNSISSGHHILSTIHADKASSIPLRMYSLLESSQDIEQFVSSIHRYVQIGIYVKGYFSARLNRFQREILEICEFYVDDETQKPVARDLYVKQMDGRIILHNPSEKLRSYMAIGNVTIPKDYFGIGDADEKIDDSKRVELDDDGNLVNSPDGNAKPAEEKPESSIKDKTDPFNMNGDNVITPSSEEGDSATPATPVDGTTPPVEASATPASPSVTPAPAAPVTPAPAPVAAPAEPTEQLIDTLPIEEVNQIERATPQVNDISNNIVANNQQNVMAQIQNTEVPPVGVTPPEVAPVAPQVTTSFNSRPVVSGYMQTPPADAVIN